MTALPHTTPILPDPPIYGYLDYGPTHNPTMATEFLSSGPVGLLHRYTEPAFVGGWGQNVIVRMIPEVDWEWLNSWAEAALRHYFNLILYCNPKGWSPGQAQRLLSLACKVILEFNGQQAPSSWVRGFLADRLVAVEPGIEATDAIALSAGLPMVLTDAEWRGGYPGGPVAGGWAHAWQVDPVTYAGGVLRRYQGDYRDLPAWYASCRARWCKGVVIGADAAILGWTAQKIRGQT